MLNWHTKRDWFFGGIPFFFWLCPSLRNNVRLAGSGWWYHLCILQIFLFSEVLSSLLFAILFFPQAFFSQMYQHAIRPVAHVSLNVSWANPIIWHVRLGIPFTSSYERIHSDRWPLGDNPTTNVQSAHDHRRRTSPMPSLQVSNPHSNWLWSRRISTFSTSLAPCSSTRTMSTNILGLTKLYFCRSSSDADIFQPTTSRDCRQILRK